MRIAIASGKGGTGKTTLAINLARVAGPGTTLLDCDVEEPNAHLFLKGTAGTSEPIRVLVPEVDFSLCDGCGECARACEFNAIAVAGGRPVVFPELCHSCGGCTLACPRHAIREVERQVGTVETLQAQGLTLVTGRLDIGVAAAPPVIRAVKRRIPQDGLAIVDAPPGTSCPVIAALKGMDHVVLVTEPTPFGLHDLTLAVDLVRVLGLPFGVVVNRMGAGDDRVHAYCRKESIPLLAEIPDDRRIAEAYSRGEILVNALPEYRPLFESLLKALKDRLLPEGGRAC